MSLTGRTVTKFWRIGIDDVNGVVREVPFDTISPVGFQYDEVELTAWQDAVKGYLTAHPDAAIDFGGPFDTSAAVGFSATTVAPALSGSHTVLYPINGLQTPLAFGIMIGIRAYWAAGDPVFGIVTASATAGYLLTKYTVDGEKYSARVVPFPGCTPAWGSTIIA